MATVLDSKPVVVTQGAASVFDLGLFPTDTLHPSHEAPPPKPVLIVAPTVAGHYPVVLFFHGFYLHNTFYTQLLTHVASHGYILVAPQLCKLLPPPGQTEVDDAGKVASWCATGLQTHLPKSVRADLRHVALVGHSRGGKTAFAVALGHARPHVSLKFSSLIGVDPVAGPSKCIRTDPKILTGRPRSFALDMPVAVIGTGLGPKPKPWVGHGTGLPNACMRTRGVNHEEFFCECKPPCAHFVVADYGHMDMLNDNLPGGVGFMAGCMCKNGSCVKELMRKCVGGIIVAFLKYSLFGEKNYVSAIVKDPSISPARLDPAPVFIQ